MTRAKAETRVVEVLCRLIVDALEHGNRSRAATALTMVEAIIRRRR